METTPNSPQPKFNLRTSVNTDRLYRAIARFQGDCPTIDLNKNVNVQNKDQSRASYKYDYATLDNILTGTKAARAKHELGVIFAPCVGGPVTCRIVHGDSGEWMEADLLVQSMQSDPKSIGSAISYAKRYLLVALLGIPVGDDTDDDGTAAGAKTKKPTYGNQQQPTPPPVITPRIQFEITNELELNLANAASLKELSGLFNELPEAGREDDLVKKMFTKNRLRIEAEARRTGGKDE